MPCNDSAVNILDGVEQYVLTEYDGDYSAVGPFNSIREAKAFASGIEFAGNEDMRILGVIQREQLLVQANVVTPTFLKAK